VALAAVFAAAAGLSTLLVLRQAPVAPESHMSELAEIRPLVEGEKVLFLGRDNFVLYELRGSKPYTHVRNFYDPYFVRPNFDLKDVGSKFDFDAVTDTTLARFPYVITTRAPYASGPPEGYRPLKFTDSYVLWEQESTPLGREPVEKGPEPAGPLRCRGPQRSAGIFLKRPIYEPASGWSSTSIEDGASASRTLNLPAGTWQLSLQYDSTRPVTLAGPGLKETLPGNLDYRGVTPFWPAGTVTVHGSQPVRIEASVEQPPLLGRLIRAHSVAHLGAIGATPAGPSYVHGAESPAPGDGELLIGDRYHEACGSYGDWRVRPR
jgi:hypothetical protein